MNLLEQAVQKSLASALGISEVAPAKEDGRLKIVVLDRGWIVVGRVSYSDGWTIIVDASVIRNWGTSRGLGEIADNGPTDKTVLDRCPPVRARNVILEMNCEEAKWKK